MSWWSCLLLGGAAAVMGDWQWALTAMPAIAVSVWISSRIKAPLADAGPMPELEEQ